VKADKIAFCKYLKIDSLRDLAAVDYNDAIHVLKQKNQDAARAVSDRGQVMQIFTCEQGSEEWRQARLGIPTASEFHTVMAHGKDGGEPSKRATYMLKLVGEILTGEQMDSYSNHHMERGKVMEDEARDLYAFMKDVTPECVGFIRNGNKGCSPDSLVDADGMAEIKTKLPHLQVECLLGARVPPEHVAQCQGALWVAEREWIDFVSYWPGLPLHVHRTHRDEEYIAKLAAAVDQFNDELAELVERIRKMGGDGPTLGETLKASLEAA
jgi:hypothetical protein